MIKSQDMGKPAGHISVRKANNAITVFLTSIKSILDDLVVLEKLLENEKFILE